MDLLFGSAQTVWVCFLVAGRPPKTIPTTSAAKSRQVELAPGLSCCFSFCLPVSAPKPDKARQRPAWKAMAVWCPQVNLGSLQCFQPQTRFPYLGAYTNRASYLGLLMGGIPVSSVHIRCLSFLQTPTDPPGYLWLMTIRII